MATQEQVIQALVGKTGARLQDIVVCQTSGRLPVHDDHTDHQLGPVNGLSVAAPGFVYGAFAPNGGSKRHTVLVESLDPEYAGSLEFDLDSIPTAAELNGHWARYAVGAVHALQQDHHLPPLERGATILVGSEIFTSAGLSSSASIGLNYLTGLLQCNGLAGQVSQAQLIELDKAIENGFLGLQNGILDQGIITLGEAGKLVYMDCEAYADGNPDFFRIVEPGAGMPEFKIFFLYSGKQRDLTENRFYNERVRLCYAAAQNLCDLTGREYVDGRGLSQVPATEFLRWASQLTPEERAVAMHVYGAIERINEGTRLWEQGDLGGQLITAAGYSLDQQFHVGSTELQSLTGTALTVHGVVGARQVGAGIGGGVAAFVPVTECYDQVIGELGECIGHFKREFPEYRDTARLVECTPADGITVHTCL